MFPEWRVQARCSLHLSPHMRVSGPPPGCPHAIACTTVSSRRTADEAGQLHARVRGRNNGLDDDWLSSWVGVAREWVGGPSPSPSCLTLCLHAAARVVPPPQEMMESAVNEVRTKLRSSSGAMTQGTAEAGAAGRSGDVDQLLASAALAVLEVRCFPGKALSHSVGLCACGCLSGSRSSCVRSMC